MPEQLLLQMAGCLDSLHTSVCCYLQLKMVGINNTTFNDGTTFFSNQAFINFMSLNFGMPRKFEMFLSNQMIGDGSTPRSGGYGCDDPFAIFGFLAFLLALLQLLVDSGGEEGGMKKRSVNQCTQEQAVQSSPQLREGVLGAYIMFQGFLNAVDAEDGKSRASLL